MFVIKRTFKQQMTMCMVFIKYYSLKSDIFFHPLFSSYFSGSRFSKVQVFQGPGFSGSRFYWVHLKDFSNPYRLDRKFRGGGVLVYLRNNIPSDLVKLDQKFENLKVPSLN